MDVHDVLARLTSLGLRSSRLLSLVLMLAVWLALRVLDLSYLSLQTKPHHTSHQTSQEPAHIPGSAHAHALALPLIALYCCACLCSSTLPCACPSRRPVLLMCRTT